MKCPICGSSNLKVTNSRSHKEGIRRRRECKECLTRFSTFENVLLSSIDQYVVKKVKI